MTEEQFKNTINIGSLIYDNEKEVIVKINSSWIRGERRGTGFPNGRLYILKEEDANKWHIVDNNDPLFVRFEVLKKEFKELQEFVSSRLK